MERDDAIVSVPEDKRLAEDFGRRVVLDLTTQEKEFELLMYPVSTSSIGMIGKTDLTAFGMVQSTRSVERNFAGSKEKYLRISKAMTCR